MRVLNCLIVEDEHLAAGVIKEYIDQLPGLKLKAVCGDVFSANEILREEKIDIIFLDINLPKMNGLEFMNTISPAYHIIITTAYHEYALEGFNRNATDYLLKPVEFSRFLQAVNKVYALENRANTVIVHENPATSKYFFFNTDKKKVKVYTDDICYIESMKEYVSIHTTTRKIVTKFQIGEINRLLQEDRFIRIHKSFVVNLSKVTAYSAMDVEIGDITLPIGRTYKEIVEQRLKN